MLKDFVLFSYKRTGKGLEHEGSEYEKHERADAGQKRT